MIALLLLMPALAGPHADDLARYGHLHPDWHGTLTPLPPVALRQPVGGVERATVYGYHPYWGVDPTTLDFSRLTHLAIFTTTMETDGTLSGTGYWTSTAPTVVPLAHAAGVKVHLTVIAFDDDQHDAILPSASKRASIIAELVDLVEAYDGDGVNIDIEGMSSSYLDELVTFTQELKAALPPGQDEVWHATPAVDWSGAYAYQRLCEASDGLFIMGYGYHWTGGDPGPNAPLYGESPWSNYALDWTVQDYVDAGAPRDCLVLGLPTYGQQWSMSDPYEVPGTASATGSSVTLVNALPIAESEGRLWDEIPRTPYVIRSSGQLWYDDTDSLREKIAYTVDQGLQGTGFWALGYEGSDPAFWQMVEDETVWPISGDGGTTDCGAPDGGTADGGGAGNPGDGGDGNADGEGGIGRREDGESTGTCASLPAAGGLLPLVMLAGLRRRRPR